MKKSLKLWHIMPCSCLCKQCNGSIFRRGLGKADWEILWVSENKNSVISGQLMDRDRLDQKSRAYWLSTTTSLSFPTCLSFPICLTLSPGLKSLSSRAGRSHCQAPWLKNCPYSIPKIQSNQIESKFTFIQLASRLVSSGLRPYQSLPGLRWTAPLVQEAAHQS